MSAPRRRILILSGLIAALALVVWGVPVYLAGRAEAAAPTCLTHDGAGDRCRIDGGPLEMSGAPVFVEKFDHAFMATSQSISFTDARGEVWVVPDRTLTDGASIPTIFEPLIGDRQSRSFLEAAALHDAYCGVGNEALETYQTRHWADVHRMFYEALIVSGTPPQRAKTMFAAVYLGGPRWDDPARDLSGVSTEALIKEMEWCIEWINATEPTIEEVEAWMKDREAALLDGTSTRPSFLDEG